MFSPSWLGSAPARHCAVSFKHFPKGYRDASKAATNDDEDASCNARHRDLRVSRHWAIRVNWKILYAVGLALLVWSLIVAVLLSI